MEITHWYEDLARRLELSADVVDDLANSAWVVSEELRERLFGVEAQLWRLSRQVRKRLLAGMPLEATVARDLRYARRAVVKSIELRVVEDDEALFRLQDLAADLYFAASDVDLLTAEVQPRLQAAGGRS